MIDQLSFSFQLLIHQSFQVKPLLRLRDCFNQSISALWRIKLSIFADSLVQNINQKLTTSMGLIYHCLKYEDMFALSFSEYCLVQHLQLNDKFAFLYHTHSINHKLTALEPTSPLLKAILQAIHLIQSWLALKGSGQFYGASNA